MTSTLARLVATLFVKGQRAWAASFWRSTLHRFVKAARAESTPVEWLSYALIGASASHGLLLSLVPVYARPAYGAWGVLVLLAIAVATLTCHKTIAAAWQRSTACAWLRRSLVHAKAPPGD